MSFRSMLVPDGNAFPAFRKAACCDKQVKAGESVLIMSTKCGKLVQRHVLHRRCLLNYIEEMPLDRRDWRSKFDKMKERIITTGEPFPVD